MKYYLIAGEASGDLHASNLMDALRKEDPDAEFRFFGGDKMKAIGGTLVKHYKQLAYMGFIPVLMHLPEILGGMRLCKRDIDQWKPDVVILVDYPGFNLDIAKYIHKHRGKGKYPRVFYYISPKIWAWKEYRIKNIRRDVDELFSILPFEVKWFGDRHYPIHYVGNPCVDAVDSFRKSEEGEESMAKFCAVNELPLQPIIALLAGSRKQEIKDNLRMMIESASQFGGYQLVIAGAPGQDIEYYSKYIPSGSNVKIVFGQTYRLLSHSTAALVTSGTATLETAIMGVPQVVCYYTPVGKFISWVRKHLIKVKYISLVNLVADKEVVQELVADRMTISNIKHYLKLILPDSEGRNAMLKEYEEMNRILGDAGASAKAAKEMVKILGAGNSIT